MAYTADLLREVSHALNGPDAVGETELIQIETRLEKGELAKQERGWTHILLGLAWLRQNDLRRSLRRSVAPMRFSSIRA
jgi:hypothetical protein